MSYNLLDGGGSPRFQDQTWTFSKTTNEGIPEVVPYTYTGFHAYFQVRVHLDAFVTHSDGFTSTVRLVDGGPVNCCTPPSGGFSYTGSYRFDPQAGDTYGFKVGGSNFDSRL